MAIQLAVFLIIYLVFLAIFLFFTFFNLYHIVRFGFQSGWAYFLTFSYLGITALALVVSFFYIFQIDWSQTITLFSVSSGDIFLP